MSNLAGQPVPLHLEYRAEPVPAVRRGWGLASLLALLPGLVVPFVPFACDVAPTRLVADAGAQLGGSLRFTDADEMVGGLLGLVAFSAFPLVLWAFRRLLRRTVSPPMRGALLTAGVCGTLAVATVLAYLAAELDSADAVELSLFGSSAAILGLSVTTVVLLTVQRRGADERVTASLAGPYAAVLVLFLVGYASFRQVGWYLAIPPTLAALAETLAAAAFALRRPASRIPD